MQSIYSTKGLCPDYMFFKLNKIDLSRRWMGWRGVNWRPVQTRGRKTTLSSFIAASPGSGTVFGIWLVLDKYLLSESMKEGKAGLLSWGGGCRMSRGAVSEDGCVSLPLLARSTHPCLTALPTHKSREPMRETEKEGRKHRKAGITEPRMRQFFTKEDMANTVTCSRDVQQGQVLGHCQV